MRGVHSRTRATAGPAATYSGAEKNERVVGHTDGRAIAAASEDWRSAVDEHGIANAVLIARDNDTREALNTGARATPDAGAARRRRRHGPVTVAVGDRIICHRNDHLGALSGRRWGRAGVPCGFASRNGSDVPDRSF